MLLDAAEGLILPSDNTFDFHIEISLLAIFWNIYEPAETISVILGLQSNFLRSSPLSMTLTLVTNYHTQSF